MAPKLKSKSGTTPKGNIPPEFTEENLEHILTHLFTRNKDVTSMLRFVRGKRAEIEKLEKTKADIETRKVKILEDDDKWNIEFVEEEKKLDEARIKIDKLKHLKINVENQQSELTKESRKLAEEIKIEKKRQRDAGFEMKWLETNLSEIAATWIERSSAVVFSGGVSSSNPRGQQLRTSKRKVSRNFDKS